MSLLSLSARQPDLLAKQTALDDECYKQTSTVSNLNLEAPKNTAAAVPHELAAEDSRIRNRVVDYINAQRMLAGSAHAEQLLLELNSAAQINRGPEGVFESSRLHWDMILGRDEKIYPMNPMRAGTSGMFVLVYCVFYLLIPNNVPHFFSKNASVMRPNPLHITFKNPNWPANFITPENVLEYFCNSDNAFYDKSSCNENVRMQNISRPLEECLLQVFSFVLFFASFFQLVSLALSSCSSSMTGIQYVLWSAQPPLYVICKHRRNNMQNVTPLAYYYIINGTVYQAPDVYTFVQSRLLGAVEPLKNAFDQVIQYSRYNVAKGYYWQFDKKPATKKDEEKSEEEKPLQARSTHFQKTRTHMLMQNLFEIFPAGTPLAISNPAESSEPMDTDVKSEGNAGSTTPSQLVEGNQQPKPPGTSAPKPN
ncbi:MED6 mediator sub complex component [Necator americanus]|uniref:MED6 mediator sub complex component n=1 Tax=Necator americanus TaxID=51031 RepID=W2TGB6_NECAM|nr:MED6 mediator sub complex component [Necator americanus]ETN80858.1 MED6 mediator sub complex component [Necator americanus]